MALDTLRHLRNSGDYSDLTILCGRSEFKVHRNIVCSRCPFFAKACKKNAWQEGSCGVVKLMSSPAENQHDEIGFDDPMAVQLMLDFLYLDDYDLNVMEKPTPVSLQATDNVVDHERSQNDDSDSGIALDVHTLAKQPRNTHSETADSASESTLTMHAKVYALASKYFVQELQKVALDKFEAALRTNWNASDFASALPFVFLHTPESDRSLRNVALEFITKHLASTMRHVEIQAAIRDIDALAFTLLLKRATETPKRKIGCNWCGDSETVECHNCYVMFITCGCEVEPECPRCGYGHQETPESTGEAAVYAWERRTDAH